MSEKYRKNNILKLERDAEFAGTNYKAGQLFVIQKINKAKMNIQAVDENLEVLEHLTGLVGPIDTFKNILVKTNLNRAPLNIKVGQYYEYKEDVSLSLPQAEVTIPKGTRAIVVEAGEKPVLDIALERVGHKILKMKVSENYFRKHLIKSSQVVDLLLHGWNANSALRDNPTPKNYILDFTFSFHGAKVGVLGLSAWSDTIKPNMTFEFCEGIDHVAKHAFNQLIEQLMTIWNNEAGEFTDLHKDREEMICYLSQILTSKYYGLRTIEADMKLDLAPQLKIEEKIHSSKADQ